MYKFSYLLNFNLTGATVTIVSSDYMVDESQSSVEVCASLTDIPAGGLECEVVSTINTTDGTKASMSPNVCSNRGRVLECIFVFKKALLWLWFEPLLKQQI